MKKLILIILTIPQVILAQFSIQNLENSARKGNINHQKQLGYIYLYGQNNVEMDPTKAFKWFLRAAEQGDSEMQGLIGALYFQGIGVDKNYNKAFT